MVLFRTDSDLEPFFGTDLMAQMNSFSSMQEKLTEDEIRSVRCHVSIPSDTHYHSQIPCCLFEVYETQAIL